MEQKIIKHSPLTATKIKFAERMAHTGDTGLGAIARALYAGEHYARLPAAYALTLVTKIFSGVNVLPNSFNSKLEEVRFRQGFFYHAQHPLSAIVQSFSVSVPTAFFLAANPELNLRVLVVYLTYSVVRDTISVHTSPVT